MTVITRWSRRAATVLAVAVLALGAGLATITGTASATAVADCRTVASHLVDRPDNGHGTPSAWALDTMTRTVKVCHVPTEPAPAAAKVEIDTWVYTALLVDDGTFVTHGGATGSPNNGKPLTGGVHGTVTGGAAYAKFTAPHDWIAWNGAALDGKTFTGSAPSSTGDWIGNLWADGFSGAKIDVYKWVYTTKCGDKPNERWTDSSEKGNGDGTADGPHGAGDITGKPCPSASPSPSVSATVSPGASASPSTVPVVPAGLPVTGSKAAIVGVTGLALLGVGVVLVMTARRRRTTFTA